VKLVCNGRTRARPGKIKVYGCKGSGTLPEKAPWCKGLGTFPKNAL